MKKDNCIIIKLRSIIVTKEQWPKFQRWKTKINFKNIKNEKESGTKHLCLT